MTFSTLILLILSPTTAWADSTRTIRAGVLQGMPSVSVINSSATIASPTTGGAQTYLTTISTATVTNKTMSGASNTFTNIPANTGLTSQVPIANGGTAASTKAGGFDALSPMSASGDIIYGGASGTGTRLAKDTDGKFLTLASGVPAWANPSAGTVESWKGYHAGTSCSWTRTNTSFGDFTGSASCTLTEEKNSGFGTVTSTSDGNPLPGITFTPSGVNQYYHVCATPVNFACGSAPTQTCAFRLTTDTQTVAEVQLDGASGRFPGSICGDIFFATAASHSVYWYCKATSGTCQFNNTGGVRGGMDWSIHRIK